MKQGPLCGPSTHGSQQFAQRTGPALLCKARMVTKQQDLATLMFVRKIRVTSIQTHDIQLVLASKQS